MDFLSLPNCAPEVFVHARRDVFVVRMCDVFAYRFRVLEAVTANAARSRAKMYGRHSGLFGSSLGLGIFKSCKKNRNRSCAHGASQRTDAPAESRMGAVAWAMRLRLVSP